MRARANKTGLVYAKRDITSEDHALATFAHSKMILVAGDKGRKRFEEG